MQKSKVKFKIQNFQKGFTLIELLIVIAIIGVLSAILFANFVGVRQRARDAQRKSDLRQIQAALEIYRSDVGSYPNKSGMLSELGCPESSALSYGTVVYMKMIPCDPTPHPYYNESWNGEYQFTRINPSSYSIYACIENQNDSDSNIFPDSGDTANICSGDRKAYWLYNP